MGLWMKCPKCQTHNPLFVKACSGCGGSLDHLPLEKRIYVLEPAGAAPGKSSKPSHLLKATPTPESPLPATTPEAAAAAKGAKAPKKPRKKKP